MPAPWPTMRTFSQKGGIADNGLRRSAAVGPATSTKGLTGDVENQHAFAGVRHVAVTGTSTTHAEASPDDVPMDAGTDGVDTQVSVLTFLKIVTALSALYMCTNPWFFFYNADKGEICPTTVLCSTTWVEMILLTGSRISAGVLFASLTISIVSKCYATRSYLHDSWLGAVLDFEPSHDVHTYFGYLSLVAALEHATLHCARFIYAKNSHLIYGTDTGRSGLVGFVLLLPIVLPMKSEAIRAKLSFQFRKMLHLLFLPLMVALCFHSVVFRYVGTILILWYLSDRLYFTTRQTFLIAHPVFEAVGRGTMVVLDMPVGYTFKAGSYIYVNSPMISRSEWHPFSIIQVPGSPPRAAFYAEAVGDWTQALFHLGLEQPRLPLWITAAQPSLMEQSIYYDNVVLVCTGAGITPAVSIIERFSKKKNIRLLWLSRDRAMVALFERQLRKVISTVHLTGNQTEDTKAALRRLLQPSKNERQEDGNNNSTRAKGSVERNRKTFSSIITNESFTPRSSTSPTDEEKSEISDDKTEVDSSVPGKLDDILQNRLAVPGARSLSTESNQPPSRLTLLNPKPTNPVTLMFGRPDIGAYLKDTFAMRVESPGVMDESGLDTSDEIDRSKRLDSEQAISKETLMMANEEVVKACQEGRTSSWVKGTKNKANTTSMSTASPGACSQLPWLVLYCGANPKVEEAIGKTCDELCVKWQKEYFGAW